MPNHVINKLTISTRNLETAAEVRELIADEDGFIDFAILLPQPRELRDIHTGSAKIDGEWTKLWREEPCNADDDGAKRNASDHGYHRALAVSATYEADLMRKYGATNWRDWQVLHWGTKWNAYGHERPVEIAGDERWGELTAEFDTAWGPPEGWYEALRDRLPDSVDIAVNLSGGWECEFCNRRY
jgi:hypothetical protein